MANYPDIDALLAKFEGFGKDGTLATVNNNPGNLISGPFSTAQGATGTNSGFATFPDPATGFAAADALVTKYANQGLTLQELINKWSPPDAAGNTPASTQNYMDFMSNQLGVPATTKLTDIGAPTTTQSQTSSNAIVDALGKILLAGSQAPSNVANAALAPVNAWFASLGRIAAFVLGIVCIIGSIYLFKPEVIEGAATHAATLAATIP